MELRVLAVMAGLMVGGWPGFAQATAPAAVPPLAGIAHVAIRVHDLAASEAFYNKLGIERAFELSRDGAVYESYHKVNDRQFIELYTTTAKETEVGFMHLCFEGDDLNAIHDDYVSRGLTPIAVRKAGAGNLLFTLAGPMQPGFAQNIEYTQYLPGSLHSNDFGKHLDAPQVARKLVSVTLAMQDPAAARMFYADKLRFVPAGDGVFKLPGGSGQTVAIVPAAELGRRARVMLRTDDLKKAAARLREQGVAVTLSAHALTVTDPDGNILVLNDPAGDR